MGTISNQNAAADWWQAGSGTTYDNTYLAVRSHAVLGSRRFTVLQFDLSGSIAQGDTIDTCVLDLVVSEAVGTWVDMDCEVYAEDVDSASANLTSIYTMTKTTANVAWVDTTGNSQGTAMTSPELKTVLQEIVNRPSWDGTVNFILWGTTTTGGYGTFGSLDQATYTKPNISVTYSPSTLDGDANPGAATVTTTVPAVKTDPVTVSPAAVGVTVTAPADTIGTGPSTAQPDAATVSVGVPRPAIETTGGFGALPGIAGRDYTVFWPTDNDVEAGEAPPVVHWVHGGAFTSGTRNRSDSNENACPLSWSEHVRAQGFVVVSSDYNVSTVTLSGFDYLCDGPTHPVAIKTVKTHIKEVQDDLGVNTDRYFLAAHSAGTQIALMAALTVGDTNDYVGYQNNNYWNALGTNEGRDGWYTGSFSAGAQTYDYNYEVWGGGSAPDLALTTGGDIQPIKGVFCYAPLWAMADAQDAGSDQRNVLRNYFGQTATGAYVSNLNFEGDPDDYVTPVSGSVHHDVRGTTKRLPTTAGPNGTAIAFAAASSSSDTVVPSTYGIDAMVSRFNTEGIAIDSAVNTMSTAGESVLDAADVERAGLTRIELPSGTAHEDVTFDSAPEDFITWANEVSVIDAEFVHPGEQLATLTVPTPSISVSANVDLGAVYDGSGYGENSYDTTNVAPSAAVTAPADTLGGISAGGDGEVAAVAFTVGDSEGATSSEIAEPDAVPAAFTVPAVSASADASITVSPATADFTVAAIDYSHSGSVNLATVYGPGSGYGQTGFAGPPVTVGVGTSEASGSLDAEATPDAVSIAVDASDPTVNVSATVDLGAVYDGTRYGETGYDAVDVAPSVAVTAPVATAFTSVTADAETATASVTVPAVTAGASDTADAEAATASVTAPAVTASVSDTADAEAAAVGVTVPAVTAVGTFGAQPGAATVAVTVPAHTAAPGGGAVPDSVAATVTVAAVTAGTTADAAAEAATATVTVPAVTASASDTADAETATASVTVPAVTASASDTADAQAATTTATVPAPAVSVGETVAPDSATVTVTATDGTVTHTGSTDPAAASLTAIVPTPDIGVGANIPNAGVGVLVFVSPSVTAQGTGSAPGEAATVAVDVPAPTVSVGETVTPDAATVTVTANDAAAVGGAGVTTAPATVDFVAADAAALRVDADGEAADVAVSVPTPTISATAEVVLAAIVVSALVRPVAISTGLSTLRIRGTSTRSDTTRAGPRSDNTRAGRRQSTPTGA